LNLAEFPIASLASRPNRRQKTLHFEDTIWDKRLGRRIPRKLTIAASELYGLPTALDDEVILGLIQLTQENQFQNRRVFFSRYALLKLLGWRNEGKSYARLETSLKRWLGVTFYYENAWWDRQSSSWVNESFHLLERVSILAGSRAAANRRELALSSFLWNEIVFRSFQAGYLKRVDMELFRSLKSPIAKRLYRFLDKRFHHKTTWEFELRELAQEHIGLSRSYDNGQLKRKLLPAIEELETKRFLVRIEKTQRFRRIKKGVWHVRFVRAKRDASKKEDDPEVRSLRRYGVHRKTARELAAGYPAETIRHYIRLLEWILKQPGIEKPKSVAGYLVQSIRQGYASPVGFRESANERTTKRRPPAAAENPRETFRQRKIAEYLEKCPASQKRKLRAESMAAAKPSMREALRRAESQNEPLLIHLYRRLILEEHVAGILDDSTKRR
jgi:hypothetical protein